MDTDVDLTPPQQIGTQPPAAPPTAVRYGSNLAWCTAQFSAVRDAEGRPHAVNRTCNHCNAVVVTMPSRPGTLEQRHMRRYHGNNTVAGYVSPPVKVKSVKRPRAGTEARTQTQPTPTPEVVPTMKTADVPGFLKDWAGKFRFRDVEM